MDGVEATASDVSVMKVNCELTEGVEVTDVDVDDVVAFVYVNVEVTVGRLITVPLDVVVVLPTVVVMLPTVVVMPPVIFPVIVDVMVKFPLVIVVIVTGSEVVPLTGGEVMVDLR